MAEERARFVTHKGQRVLLLDFSKCGPEEVSAVIGLAAPVIRLAGTRSLLTLTDVTDIVVRDASTRQLVDFAGANRPYVKEAAIVGVSGLARSILSTTVILTGRSIQCFDTREGALNWLVTQG
jgi:hypothetical protein